MPSVTEIKDFATRLGKPLMDRAMPYVTEIRHFAAILGVGIGVLLLVFMVGGETVTRNVGVAIGVASLLFTAWNSFVTTRVNRARFWLDLRDRFAKHDEVHRHLRPGGKWSNGDGPESSDEWAQVEAYMGLFEHCETMLKEKLIDEQTFEHIYRYRLKNIVANDRIRVAKLENQAKDWKLFLELMRRMKVNLPDSA